MVLGASLFRHPPGEYPIAEVADFVLLDTGGSFGAAEFAALGGALYVSPIGSGPPTTYRVPYAALVAAGAGAHSVVELADATFTGANHYSHVLVTCDLDADGSEDLVMGAYAVPGVRGMAGPVDLDADGLLVSADLAHVWGPCTDLDGDGRSDDFTAVIQEPEPSGEAVNYALHVWYGPVSPARVGTTLPLGEPDVVLRVGARKTGQSSNMEVVQDAVGDWDGDGNADLAMSVIGNLPESYDADVLVFLGQPGFRPPGTTLTRADAAVTVGTTVLPRSIGSPLSLAGDLNGDGRDDLVLGDYLDGDEHHARYCPLPPGEYSPAEFAQVTWAAADANDVRFLLRLETRGDLDGNGTDDVVLGAPDSTEPHRHGAVLVLAKQ